MLFKRDAAAKPWSICTIKLFSTKSRRLKQRVNEGFITFCGQPWHFNLKAELWEQGDQALWMLNSQLHLDLEVCDKEILVEN